MTEPVAAAVSPRRTVRVTVRVAVGLVAGQALLCAVLGWLTFGPSDAGETPARVEPVAAPSLAMPTAGPVLPPAPAASTSAPPSRRPAQRTTPPRVRPTTPAVQQAPEEKPTTVRAPEDDTSLTPTKPDPGLAVTDGPDDLEDVQGPVVAGEPCDPAGAPGRTADDQELRCLPDARDRLVWQAA